MKIKYFKILLLAPFILNADVDSTFIKGKNLLSQKNYDEAYKVFYKLSQDDLSNMEIAFFVGRSAYEKGEYDLAISYYERILFQQPSNLRVKLEIAQSYLMLKNYIQAKKEFNEILKNNIPKNVRENIKSKLAFIDNSLRKHFFSGQYLLDIIYDTNVDNSPNSGDYTVYVPEILNNVTLNNSGEKNSDYSLQNILALNHKYKINDNFYFNNDLVLLSQNYDEKKDSDIQVVSFLTSPTFLEGKDRFSFALGLDKVNLDNKAYLNIFNTIFSNTHIFSQTSKNDLSLKISKKYYQQNSDKEKNSLVFDLKNNYKIISNKYGMFSFNLNFIKEIEEKENRTDVSKNSYIASIQNDLPLQNKFNLTTKIENKKIIYREQDINFLTKRTDNNIIGSVMITKQLSKNLSFSLTATHSNVNSNQESFSYDKNVVKTSLNYSF